MDRAGFRALERLPQPAVQVAAMKGDVREAVALDRFDAEIEQLPALPAVPEPDRLAGRQHLHLFQRLLEAERMENAGAVGADLDAGAKLAQLGRLLIDVDVDSAPEQRERRRKPADARAYDCDRGRHIREQDRYIS